MRSLTRNEWNDRFDDEDIVVMNDIITKKKIAMDLAKLIKGEPLLFPASKEQIINYLNTQEDYGGGDI